MAVSIIMPCALKEKQFSSNELIKSPETIGVCVDRKAADQAYRALQHSDAAKLARFIIPAHLYYLNQNSARVEDSKKYRCTYSIDCSGESIQEAILNAACKRLRYVAAARATDLAYSSDRIIDSVGTFKLVIRGDALWRLLITPFTRDDDGGCFVSVRDAPTVAAKQGTFRSTQTPKNLTISYDEDNATKALELFDAALRAGVAPSV